MVYAMTSKDIQELFDEEGAITRALQLTEDIEVPATESDETESGPEPEKPWLANER